MITVLQIHEQAKRYTKAVFLFMLDVTAPLKGVTKKILLSVRQEGGRERISEQDRVNRTGNI